MAMFRIVHLCPVNRKVISATVTVVFQVCTSTQRRRPLVEGVALWNNFVTYGCNSIGSLLSGVEVGGVGGKTKFGNHV